MLLPLPALYAIWIIAGTMLLAPQVLIQGFAATYQLVLGWSPRVEPLRVTGTRPVALLDSSPRPPSVVRTVPFSRAGESNIVCYTRTRLTRSYRGFVSRDCVRGQGRHF